MPHRTQFSIKWLNSRCLSLSECPQSINQSIKMILDSKSHPCHNARSFSPSVQEPSHCSSIGGSLDNEEMIRYDSIWIYRFPSSWTSSQICTDILFTQGRSGFLFLLCDSETEYDNKLWIVNSMSYSQPGKPWKNL